MNAMMSKALTAVELNLGCRQRTAGVDCVGGAKSDDVELAANAAVAAKRSRQRWRIRDYEVGCS